MTHLRWLAALTILGTFVVAAPRSASQPGKRPDVPSTAPRLEPVAETKLLMEGLTRPNFDGLVRTLADRPREAEAWTFARGQALLVAESGNLLLMRPPKARAAQDAWMARATEVRESATRLARSAAARDYPAARADLANLANACNKCHSTFGVAVRVDPLGPDRE